MRPMHDHPLVEELTLTVVLERAASETSIDPSLLRQLEALCDADLLRSLAQTEGQPGSASAA